MYGSPAGGVADAVGSHYRLDAGLPALRVRVAEGLRRATIAFACTSPPASRGPPPSPTRRSIPWRGMSLEVSADEARTEQVVPTAPLHRLVTRFTGDCGATLFSDGLAEYESLTRRRRCGHAAARRWRALEKRPARASRSRWLARTHARRTITRSIRGEPALAMHGPDSPATRDQIEELADDVLLPISGETLRSNLGEPLSAGGLELSATDSPSARPVRRSTMDGSCCAV